MISHSLKIADSKLIKRERRERLKDEFILADIVQRSLIRKLTGTTMRELILASDHITVRYAQRASRHMEHARTTRGDISTRRISSANIVWKNSIEKTSSSNIKELNRKQFYPNVFTNCENSVSNIFYD